MYTDHRSKSKWFGRRAFAAPACAALIAITVGSGASVASASSARASAAANAAPIKIGAVLTLSGVFAGPYGAAEASMKAWQSYVNANGGINGHPVQFTFKDDRSDPATTLTIMKKFVADGDVAAIIGAAAEEAGIGALTQSHHLPMIGITGSDPSTWGARPNYFQSWLVYPNAVTSNVDASKLGGATNIGSMVCAEVDQCKTAGTVISQEAVAAHVKYVGLQTVAAAATDANAQCLSLIGAGANAITLSLAIPTEIKVMNSCVQQGYKGIFSSPQAQFDPGAFSQGLPAGVRIVSPMNGFPWWASNAPAQVFRHAMAKYQPHTAENSGVTATWSALELFRKAVSSQHGAITRATIAAGYATLKHETLQGLLAQPVTFTAGKPAPKVTCFWAVNYRTGNALPKIIAPVGKSGNGAHGDLASTCTAG
jgi:branched-chain amino acid transport system substrate-binding protein